MKPPYNLIYTICPEKDKKIGKLDTYFFSIAFLYNQKKK